MVVIVSLIYAKSLRKKKSRLICYPNYGLFLYLLYTNIPFREIVGTRKGFDKRNLRLPTDQTKKNKRGKKEEVQNGNIETTVMW